MASALVSPYFMRYLVRMMLAAVPCVAQTTGALLRQKVLKPLG